MIAMLREIYCVFFSRHARKILGFVFILITVGFASTLLAASARPNDLEEINSFSAQWQMALRLEEEAVLIQREAPRVALSKFKEASQRFERVADEPDGPAMALWRSARCAWLAADLLPLADADGRVTSFTRVDELATRGLERDPECAECMLWKFSAMARLQTTVGVLKGIRQLSEMATLLDRGIALEPTYADTEWNSTLGNLYYASASFHRVVPDWFWLKWFIGVRGDKERARANIHAALALHPVRIDYQVELGAQLLCQGAKVRRQRAQLQAGREILEGALLAPPLQRDARRDREAARVMLQMPPAKACGYTGDDWVEVSTTQARAVQSSIADGRVAHEQ